MAKAWQALRALAREPLLHFLVLGALIFAADAIANPASRQDHIIAVTPEVRRDIAAQFQDKQGRPPTPAELEPLIDAWLLNEILYREARSLGLDRGDEMIRERITHKMRLLVFNNITVPDPSEDDLRAWFEAHRDRFDQPQRIDFFEVRVGEADADGERRAEQALKAIQNESEDEGLRDKVRIYQGRSTASVDLVFGPGFADSLLRLPRGVWSRIRSEHGWHIVRVDGATAAVPADFAAVRDQVADLWQQDRLRALARDAVNKLGAKYEIQRQDRT